MKVKTNSHISSLREETALSEFIHRVGHDIGNPLTSLISLASLLERSGPGSKFELSLEDRQRYLNSIMADAWRVQSIMERVVLLLSNRQEGAEGETLVEEVIQFAIRKILKKPSYQRFDVLFSAAEPNLKVNISRSSLEWLVTELLTNALTHLSSSSDELDSEVNLLVRRDGESVLIEVRNALINGGYPDPESLFAPFVKHPITSKTCGLGLSAVQAVVQRAQGEVALEASDKHFQITVTLPTAAKW